MATHPGVQAKARKEIDAVVGLNRLPEHTDVQSLPYCQAILLETLRWRPAVPLGVPHRVMVDDEYKGYYIPEGSTIIPVRPFR